MSATGGPFLKTSTVLLKQLTLYVIGFGPAVKAVWEGWFRVVPPPLSRWLETLLVFFYTPLAWLHEHTFLEGPLDKYLSLWM